MRRGRMDLLIVAVPPLLLAGAGFAHPLYLTPSTADAWRNLHVAVLPLFPLLGLAPWIVLRRENAVLAGIVAVLGYVYAIFYTALDVLAGIGAGTLERDGFVDGPVLLFRPANYLVGFGVWAFLLAAVLAALVVLRRAGWEALPGALLLVGGAWSFLDSHIYWPRGVLTMLALAAGWVFLLLSWPDPADDPDRAASTGSVRADPQR